MQAIGENKAEKNATTEEKIKEAAKRVFTSKGYAATRTRDIAEESGYNLALINYYFRSKEKLFDIIMLEQLHVFIHSVSDLLNNRNTTLEEKIEQLVAHYIDMLKESPGLPFFIMNEINADPKKFLVKTNLEQIKPYFLEQWQETVSDNSKLKINPLHLFMNVLSMTVFPFIAAPMMSAKLGIDNTLFNKLMDERKRLIPMWLKTMMEENTEDKKTQKKK